MRRLEDIRKSTQQELDDLSQNHRTADLPAAFADYQTYLQGLRKIHLENANCRDTQTKIIQRLIHKIEILPDMTRLHYYASERQFPTPDKGAGAADTFSNIFLNRGSKTIDRNGPGRNRTCTTAFGGRYDIHFTTGPGGDNYLATFCY